MLNILANNNSDIPSFTVCLTKNIIMKKSILIIAVVFAVITSCKKEKVETEIPVVAETVLDYFPLTEGSYWVYEQMKTDSNGNEIPQIWGYDSIIVKNDTEITGKIYRNVTEYNYLGSSNPLIHLYRDSADCIVTPEGDIVFSLKNGFIYREILIPDSVVYVDYWYVSQTTPVTVPLGTYSCVDFRGDVYTNADNYSTPRLLHNYYYLGIGRIKSANFYLTSHINIYRNLVRYHIQ